MKFTRDIILNLVVGALGLGAVTGIAWKILDIWYDKGVAACQAAQEAADDEVEAKTTPAIKANAEIDAEQQKSKTVIKETYRTGVTQADIEHARAAGKAEGEENARLKLIAEARLKGGCLVVPYESDSELWQSSRSIKRRLREAGVGSYADPIAKSELSGGWPKTEPVPEVP